LPRRLCGIRMVLSGKRKKDMEETLEDRMKGYEAVTRTVMTGRLPVIIRVDGKAFHTFTRGMTKPFDRVCSESMKAAMLALCSEIEGTVVGYWQSDEITIVLAGGCVPGSMPWFGNSVQKCASIAASIATRAFNAKFMELTDAADMRKKYEKQRKALATFDARAFPLPWGEVCNCLIWRQFDAIRNSVSSLAQANFSQKELGGKKAADMKAMLKEKGNDWDSLPTEFKRGACAIKKKMKVTCPDGSETERSKWVIDGEIPLFSEKREYVTERLEEKVGSLEELSEKPM